MTRSRMTIISVTDQGTTSRDVADDEIDFKNQKFNFSEKPKGGEESDVEKEKFEQRDFEITTNEGMAKVNGYCSQHLGIHMPNGQVRWKITHIASGFIFPDGASEDLDQVKSTVTDLENMACDWSKTSINDIAESSEWNHLEFVRQVVNVCMNGPQPLRPLCFL